MIRLLLNRKKFNNYAFFCPVSKLHVTVSNPMGFIDEINPNIVRAVKLETLIDVDNIIDIETGKIRGISNNLSEEEPKVEENIETKEESEVAETKEEVEKPKRGRQPKKETE